MAFVNEKYPQSEKSRVDALVANRPKSTRLPGSSRWTIDRERDAYLVLIGQEGGGYEGTQLTKHFSLAWEGEVIHFAIDRIGVSESDRGVIISWRLHKLDIPSELEGRFDEVMTLIREAFAAYGDAYNGEQFYAVNVELDLASSR